MFKIEKNKIKKKSIMFMYHNIQQSTLDYNWDLGWKNSKEFNSQFHFSRKLAEDSSCETKITLILNYDLHFSEFWSNLHNVLVITSDHFPFYNSKSHLCTFIPLFHNFPRLFSLDNEFVHTFFSLLASLAQKSKLFDKNNPLH